jgi:uncharacterized protein YuzE
MVMQDGGNAGEIVKMTYDPEVDVVRMVFSNEPIEKSDAIKPGVILDYARDGNVVGMEILNASKLMENPRSLEYLLAS